MKYYFGGLIGLCIVIILFITRCDKTCQMTKSITKNLKQAQEQQMIYSGHVDKAGEYYKKYQEEIKQASKAKVSQWKHEKQASNIYGSGLAFGNYAYAGWDEGLTGAIIAQVETGHSKRDLLLMSRVCGTAKGRSPMCNDWTMYYSGKQIFEEAGVPRGIALGIMNAESNIGVNYAGTCNSSWNNRGGIKYKLTDIGLRIKDQPIPNDGNGNKGGCWLYKFDNIEEYFRSKANTLGIGYESCFKTDNPIRCISYSYVGNPKVAETSWIKNVAKIAD